MELTRAASLLFPTLFLAALPGPAPAQPDQAYPPLHRVAREKLNQHAEAHDEGVDIVYWNEREGVNCAGHIAHWVFSTGWVTEMAGDTVIGTRFATFKYDATHPGPAAPQPQAVAYHPPLHIPLNPGDTYKAAAMAVDPSNGDVYVVGEGPRTGGNDQDYHLIKYDRNLVEQWVQHYDGTASGDDIPVDVAIDAGACEAPATVVLVAGTSPGDGTGQDITTVAWYADGLLATDAWLMGPGQPQAGVRRYNYDLANGDDMAVELGRVGFAITGNSPMPILGAVVLGTSWGGNTFNDFATIGWVGPIGTGPPNWVQRYHHYRNDIAVGLSDLDVLYITGHSEQPPSAGSAPGGVGGGNLIPDLNIDITTLSYLPDGTPRWAVKYDYLQHDDFPKDIEVTEDSANQSIYIWIAGWTMNPVTDNGELAALLYTEPPLIPIAPTWAQRIALGTGDLQYAVRIAPLTADGMYLTGAWVDPPRDAVLTLKYVNPPLPSGLPSWYRTYSVGGFDEGRGIVIARVDEFGLLNYSIYITGTSSVAGQGRDFMTMRYRE